MLPSQGVPHQSPAGGCCPHALMVGKLVWKLRKTDTPAGSVWDNLPICQLASTGSLLWGAVRNTWRAAEPPASSCLLREHLLMTSEVHGQGWSSRELRKNHTSPLPPHQPCSAWLPHYRGRSFPAQCPASLSVGTRTAPCCVSRTHSAALHRKKKSALLTCAACPAVWTCIPI